MFHKLTKGATALFFCVNYAKWAACIKKILKINTSQNHKFIQVSTETCIKNAKYMVRHGAEIYTSQLGACIKNILLFRWVGPIGGWHSVRR